MNEKWYTRAGAAAACGVSVSMIDVHRRSGRLACSYEGRTVLFAESELKRWTNELAAPRVDSAGERIYSRPAAAAYLGITRQALSSREKHKSIAPDIVEENGRVFYFERTLRRAEGAK